MAETKKKPAAKAPRTFYLGTGRRKTAVARVRITEGKGQVLINGKPLEQYFHEDKDRAAVLGPLKARSRRAGAPSAKLKSVRAPSIGCAGCLIIQ